ncbi:unnamed protein product, partial [Prorocentrum cordatum]
VAVPWLPPGTRGASLRCAWVACGRGNLAFRARKGAIFAVCGACFRQGIQRGGRRRRGGARLGPCCQEKFARPQRSCIWRASSSFRRCGAKMRRPQLGLHCPLFFSAGGRWCRVAARSRCAPQWRPAPRSGRRPASEERPVPDGRCRGGPPSRGRCRGRLAPRRRRSPAGPPARAAEGRRPSGPGRHAGLRGPGRGAVGGEAGQGKAPRRGVDGEAARVRGVRQVAALGLRWGACRAGQGRGPAIAQRGDGARGVVELHRAAAGALRRLQLQQLPRRFSGGPGEASYASWRRAGSRPTSPRGGRRASR